MNTIEQMIGLAPVIILYIAGVVAGIKGGF